MVALAGGVLAHVDPVTSVTRALLAFLLGWIGGQVWHVVLTVVGQSSREESESEESEQALDEHQPAA